MRFSHLSVPSLLGALALAGVACSDQNGGASAPQVEQVGSSSSQLTAPSLRPGSSTLTAPRVLETPSVIDQAAARALVQHGHYERTSKLSAETKANVKKHKVHSIPHFSGSYTLDGKTYPYTMVGGAPERGDTTRVKTTLIPVSLVFDQFADPATGMPLTVDVTPDVKPVLESPNFLRSDYGTGHTQYQDAIQRAEFWNVMEHDWHTLIEAPRMQKTITLEVPVGAARIFQVTAGGPYITILDQNFFFSQFNTILQLADFHPDELAMLLTPNVFLGDGNPNDGVIIGFHTAWDAENPEAFLPDPATANYVQTFEWASWIEPGLFGGAFSDVTALTHEVAEWVNDPFVDNATETWAFPTTGGTLCQNNLETGDPVEVLANPSFPVTLHGYTYHPQTEALLQWFSRETPSSAFQGAYSYPDTTALPSFSEKCSIDAGF